MRKHMRNSKGFTLLELMIVAGIFMLVLIPVLAVFTSSYESYLVQDDISATQQNMRSAMMYLRRDIRMAGAGFGTDFETIDLYDHNENGNSSEVLQIYGITARNGAGPNGSSDELILQYIDFDPGICGEPASPCTDLPVLIIPNDIVQDDTAVTIHPDDRDDKLAQWSSDCTCGSVTLNYSNDDNETGLFLLLTSSSSDGKIVDLAKIDDINSSDGTDIDTVTFSDGLQDHEGPITSSFISQDAFRRIHYYLDPDNPTVLMREVNNVPQPLAEGIEDIQFDYFGDFDGDGVEEWYNENWNFAGDGNFIDVNVNEVEQRQVRMVRIRMIARTSGEYRDLHASEKPVLDEFAGADVVTDNFRRRVIVQDVQVRSLGL